MATTKATPARLLLPLLPLALATAAAFALAIRSGWADLSQVWTGCCSSSSSSSSPGAGAGGPYPLPTPLCFAVSFFQLPLAASRRARLEEAAIVGLLAALATVTASEAARARARARARRARGPRSGAAPAGADHKTAVGGAGGSDGSDGSGNDNSLSARVVQGPALPWLLYNLALGAFCWQAVIVPASIVQHHRRGQQSSYRPAGDEDVLDDDYDDDDEDGPDPAPTSLTIPLSVALGLLLPSALMLARPASAAAVLVWLVFPLWVALARRLPLPLPRARPAGRRRLRLLRLCAVPVLWSAASHVLLLADLLGARLPALLAAPGRSSSSSSAVRSAMLLLEVDHAAIFATYLYWAHATSASRRAGARAVATAVVSALLLGPGAGVCLGWWGAGRLGGGGGGGGSGGDGFRVVVKQQHQQYQQPQPQPQQYAGFRGASRQAGRRRATGTFFAGPDA